MTPKKICEVLSNNRGYYKEVIDYWPFAKSKIGAFGIYKNPDYKQANIQGSFEQFMG
jgi:hypothetical protein